MNNQFNMNNQLNNEFNMNNDYNNQNEVKDGENLDNSLYTDGIDKKPKLVIIIGGIVVLLIIVLICFFACGNRKKSTNNYLSSITVTGGIFTPEFNKDTIKYDVFTEKEIVTVSCTTESKKAATNGCNERVVLNNSCVEHQVVITSEDKTKRTYILNICNQLKNAPIVKEIEVNPEKFTNGNVTVTVNATAAEETALHSEPYSFDDGITWQKSNKYVVKENTTLSIKVRDSKNVESSSMTKEINNIDKTKPVINLNGTIESGEETTSNVNITAEVTPATTTSGYTYQWYKNNSKISGATSVDYTATSSGTYKVVVKTGAGNSVTSSNYKVVKKSNNSGYNVSITKITGNATSWTKNDVTLTVTASASNGLNSKAYSFDGGSSWQASNSKKFSSNGKVKIVIRDSKGNKSSVSTQTISKIDKTTPTITISGSTTVGGTLTANVSPATTVSGYSYQWYKNDSAINGATGKNYTTTTAGTYSVKVITGAGNSSVSTKKAITVAITPTVVINGSVASGQQTNSNVNLTATVTNGTASSYKWYKDNVQISYSSSSYTATASGTYKVQVITTSNQTITSNAFVVNKIQTDTSGPTLTVKLTKGNYDGATYTSDTWTNQDVYVTVTASDSSGVSDLQFQYLNTDTIWYNHATAAWSSKDISGNNGKAKVYFHENRNDKFSVKAIDSKGNVTVKETKIKIDKVAPNTPIASGFDCYVGIKEKISNGIIEVDTNSANDFKASSTKESLFCAGTSFVVPPMPEDTSGISYCEYAYSSDTTCANGLKATWLKSIASLPSALLSKCTAKNSASTITGYYYGMRCYDNAGNVSKPLYVFSLTQK